jgi:hypothetical protein
MRVSATLLTCHWVPGTATPRSRHCVIPGYVSAIQTTSHRASGTAALRSRHRATSRACQESTPTTRIPHASATPRLDASATPRLHAASATDKPAGPAGCLVGRAGGTEELPARDSSAYLSVGDAQVGTAPFPGHGYYLCRRYYRAGRNRPAGAHGLPAEFKVGDGVAAQRPRCRGRHERRISPQSHQ